ncbi:MAG TPA: hypothetical protein VGC67_13595 [Cellulomonas sp.]
MPSTTDRARRVRDLLVRLPGDENAAVRAGRRAVVRFGADRSVRAIRVATISVPANLAMATWKAGLLLVTPSVFLAANVLFTLGVAAAKLLAIHAHRAAVRTGAPGGTDLRDPRQRGAYHQVGLLVAVLAAVYVAMCVLVAVGGAHIDQYDHDVAIAIATVAFVELGFAIHGMLVARRDREPVVEAIKLVNLSGALVLLVLAQAALMSISDGGTDPSRPCGLTGVLVGTVAVLLGLRMFLRGRRTTEA